jgi:hypothetical protein
MTYIVRMPFHFRRYDLDDPEDRERLRKDGTYIPGIEAAWPLRGPRPRDKNPPRPPSIGRRANGGLPS